MLAIIPATLGIPWLHCPHRRHHRRLCACSDRQQHRRHDGHRPGPAPASYPACSTCRATSGSSRCIGDGRRVRARDGCDRHRNAEPEPLPRHADHVRSRGRLIVVALAIAVGAVRSRDALLFRKEAEEIKPRPTPPAPPAPPSAKSATTPRLRSRNATYESCTLRAVRAPAAEIAQNLAR